MTIRTMSLDQLRDWHAKREGWNAPGPAPWANGKTCVNWWKRTESGDIEWLVTGEHPFPEDLGVADAAFPEGWNWYRQIGPQDVMWEARNDTYHHILRSHLRVVVLDTGHKITDLYRLAALAREAETKGTNEQA